MSADDHDFGHSLTDLMASVAVMFLLIAAIFMVRSLNVAKKAKQDLDVAKETQQTSFDRLEALRKTLQRLDWIDGVAEVLYDPTDPGLLTIVVSDSKLGFEPGQCVPTTEGVLTIREQFPKLLDPMCSVIEQFRPEIAQITLEGHTDAVPFWPRRTGCGIDALSASTHCSSANNSAECVQIGFSNNVRLSAARAQNVYFELRDAVADNAVLTRCLESRFVVSGRGPVEPRAPVGQRNAVDWRANRSPTEMQADRRVVLKLRVSPKVNFADIAGATQ